MNDLIPISPLLSPESPPGLVLLIAPHDGAEVVLQIIARTVLEHPVNVLDNSLRFNVHRVAHLVRLQTARVYEALHRIQLVRVFNACQLVDGLHSFAQDTFPILVFGALALFETDLLTVRRERMMLNEYLSTLHLYSQERTMILSVKPASRLQTAPWNRLLQSATHIYDCLLYTSPSPRD